jgi:glycosyltransferase involved in cell wall biosynthesis
MRIAQVAPLYERVPPAFYGGTERVVSHLTEELVRLGHDVTLFATADSITAARLEPACERAVRIDPECQDPLARHVLMLGRVYARASDFDIIHCHTDYLCLPHARSVTTPTVLTLHGRLDIPELAPLYALYDEVPLVSISAAQRRPLPHANWIDTIYHGLPAAAHAFAPTPGDAFVFLGRISPEKRPDVAIRVARRTGIRLRIAAKVDAADRVYFEQHIRPLLNDPLVEFIGEVDEATKIALLAQARALLFPIDWPEPFGLVMIEALAAGTPVIARPFGSVPEVIRDGETGWLGESEDELVEAARRIGEIDRRACRRDFEERFSAVTMAQRYVAVYESILADDARAGRAAALPALARQRLGASSGTDESARS